MSANTTPDETTVARSRPAVVDYAVYALIARCVFSLGAAFALYGARSEVSKSLADANKSKNWSAETLHSNVDSALRANMITTLVMIVLVAIVIKFIRDGKNWARFLYLVFAILITRDVFQILGFVQYHNVPARLLTGLVGVSSIAALALLFLPESNGYFRPAGNAGPGLLGGMFGPRAAANRAAATRTGANRAAVTPAGAGRADVEAAAAAQNLDEPAARQGAAPDTVPAGEQPAATRTGLTAPRAPRGKSRQSGQPRRKA